jgi:hypothetical protein
LEWSGGQWTILGLSLIATIAVCVWLVVDPFGSSSPLPAVVAAISALITTGLVLIFRRRVILEYEALRVPKGKDWLLHRYEDILAISAEPDHGVTVTLRDSREKEQHHKGTGSTERVVRLRLKEPEKFIRELAAHLRNAVVEQGPEGRTAVRLKIP